MSVSGVVSIRSAEAEKYRKIWSHPEYRDVAPGEHFLGIVLGLGIQPGCRVVDVGCGTGRAGVKLSELMIKVTLVDFVRDALDESAKELPFVEACLWDDWPSLMPQQDVAYCCDVLEHVPEPLTMLVVHRCLQAAPTVMLSIAHEPDLMGQLIGEPLHLTVKPFEHWRDHMAEIADVVDARDLLGRGLFVIRRRQQ